MAGFERPLTAFGVQPAHCAFEKGIEKVALYVKKKMEKSANEVNYLQCAHVAKQLPVGSLVQQEQSI